MLVSVILASHNPDVSMLKDAVNSVLRQTYKDFELIIVDDGSDNSIKEIICSFSNDKRIAVYRIGH